MIIHTYIYDYTYIYIYEYIYIFIYIHIYINIHTYILYTYIYIYIFMVPPLKDIPFLTYLFEILSFGIIIEQLIERGYHMYIYIYLITYKYIYIYLTYLNKRVYMYTGICTSQKIANFANFPGFKIQDSGGTF